MDPVTVFSLVAACSSLATRCAGAVKTLHSFVESYKHVEVSIVSLADECETIQFAWHRIEEWANQNLRFLDDFNHLRDRLQKSIYTCQLVVFALEEDLFKLNPDCNVKRQAGMMWNEGVFQDHRARIRGQVSCLQLILQVMNMPCYEDRIETLSVKEHIFYEAEESVLSIVPSRISTPLSITDSNSTGPQKGTSTKLRYIGMSFEDDLFTSNVYKRNYRLPSMQQGITTRSLNSVDRQVEQRRSRMLRSSRPIIPIQEIPEERTVCSGVDSLLDTCPPERAMRIQVNYQQQSVPHKASQLATSKREAKPPNVELPTSPCTLKREETSGFGNTTSDHLFKLEESLKLSFRDGIDIPERRGRNEVLERRLAVYLNHNRHADAVKLVQTDLDLAILFDERSTISSSALFRLLWYMARAAPDFLITVIQRMAFVAGLSWITRFEFAWTSIFQSYFCPKEKTVTSAHLSGRSKIEHAAGFYERTVQAAFETSCERPTAFHLACAAQSYEVVTYLLRIGLGPNSGPACAHPIIQARRRDDSDLEQILLNRLHIPRDIYTRALWSLFTPHVVHRILWYSDVGTYRHRTEHPCLLPAPQAAKIFLDKGADTRSVVDYCGQRIPGLHAVMYALHDADISREYRIEIFTLLVKGGADLDAVGEARGRSTKISVLALAAALGELDFVNVLLENGVKLFWPRLSEILHGLSEGTDSTDFEAIVCSLAQHNFLWPVLSTIDNSKRAGNSHGPNLSASDSIFASLRLEYALGVANAIDHNEQSSKHKGTIRAVLNRNNHCSTHSPGTSDSASKTANNATTPFTRTSPELVFELHSLPHYIHNDRLSREMIDFIRRRNFDHAVQSLLDGADLGVAFLPELGGPLGSMLDFLWHLWRTNAYMFFLAVQRLAFVTGASWTLELRDAFLRQSPKASSPSSSDQNSFMAKRKPRESRLDCAWRLIVRSSILTSNRRRTDKSLSSRPALYYACTARNEAVVKYLLHIGQRLREPKDAAFAMSRSTAITQLLATQCTFTSSTLVLGMEIIFKESILVYGSPMARDQPSHVRTSDLECISMLDTLMSLGVDASTSLLRSKKRVPLLHAAIYTDGPLRIDMTKLILDRGANMDCIGFVPWHESSSTTRVSALALAALIPLRDVMDLLLSRGAAWIWSDDLDLQRLAEKNFAAFYEDTIASCKDSWTTNGDVAPINDLDDSLEDMDVINAKSNHASSEISGLTSSCSSRSSMLSHIMESHEVATTSLPAEVA